MRLGRNSLHVILESGVTGDRHAWAIKDYDNNDLSTAALPSGIILTTRQLSVPVFHTGEKTVLAQSLQALINQCECS